MFSARKINWEFRKSPKPFWNDGEELALNAAQLWNSRWYDLWQEFKKNYRALNKLTSGNTVYRLYDHISQRFPLPFGGNLPNLCHQSMMSQLKWIQKTSDKCPQLSKPPLELECKAVIVELKGPFVHYQNGSEIPFRVILGFSICLFNAISNTIRHADSAVWRSLSSNSYVLQKAVSLPLKCVFFSIWFFLFWSFQICFCQAKASSCICCFYHKPLTFP